MQKMASPPTQVRRRRTISYLALLAVVAGFVALYMIFGRAVTFDDFKALGQEAATAQAAHPLGVLLLFAIAQFASGVLSVPTKGVLTILGGALLGPWLGAAVTVTAITCGTTLLFFGTRRFLRERVAAKLGTKAAWVERRLAARPISAMIGLRLMITLPYGPITLAAALSSVRFRDFLIGTLIGDLPIVILYSLAGQRLSLLASTSDALSGTTVAILLLAGVVFLGGAFLGGRKKNDELGP